MLHSDMYYKFLNLMCYPFEFPSRFRDQLLQMDKITKVCTFRTKTVANPKKVESHFFFNSFCRQDKYKRWKWLWA